MAGRPCGRLFHQKVMNERDGASVVDICGLDAHPAGDECRGQYQGARWRRHPDTGENVLTGWDLPGEMVRRERASE